VTRRTATLLPESYFVGLLIGKNGNSEAPTTEEKAQIIWQSHDLPTAGHPRIKRTLKLLSRRGQSWKGICADIKQYVDGCLVCQKTKLKIGPGMNELHPMPIASQPWEIMSWDLIGPLPESWTYDAIVTMVDTKTKAIKLEAANVTITALGAAVVMKNRVFQEEGLPAKVISNRGPQFVSRFMKELYRLLGVEGNPSTTYHPQTDGQTERINWEIKKYLQMFINHWQDDWADWLPIAEFTYNNAVHEATGHSPFYLNKGWHPWALPTDLVTNNDTPAGDYLDELQKATTAVEKSLSRAKQEMKKKWDKSKREEELYKEGDLVLVQSEYLPSKRPSRKLDDKWRGPFKVIRKRGIAIYELDLPPTWQGHQVFNSSRMKRFVEAVFPGQPRAGSRPDPIITNEGREEYEVHEVLDKKTTKKGVEYLVSVTSASGISDTEDYFLFFL
jgi:hypothetical protein